jgi:hypothetical protein
MQAVAGVEGRYIRAGGLCWPNERTNGGRRTRTGGIDWEADADADPRHGIAASHPRILQHEH